MASAASQASTARAQAKATIAQGNIATKNKVQEVARKAATQRVSFLNSGITLEGTPMNVIESTFNTGIDDLNQLSSNYNTAAKNQIAAGRSAAIQSLAGGFSGAAMPNLDLSDFASDVGAGFNSFASGTGFDLGYDVSQSFRKYGGGFKPGEFI